MSQDRGRQPQSDGKGNSGGYSYLLYALVCIAAILVGLSLITNLSTDELTYENLVQLIEATPYKADAQPADTPEPTGSIIVTQTKKNREIEYSGLHEVAIGTYSVVGKVNRKIVSAADVEP